MAATYEYAVLTAIPDARRGERANVGMVVFRPERVDVRFDQVAYKLRALTGNALDERIETAQARFESMHVEGQTPEEALKRFAGVEPMLKPSNLGYFVARSESEYEERVKDVLYSLVRVPKRERKTQSRLNTELAVRFRKLRILAKGEEGIEDKKIVRDFRLPGSEGLVADFALKNGKLHVTSTLDLRKASAGMGDAALKSIILDTAKDLSKKKKTKTTTIGVYAVNPDMEDHFAREIHLFERYSDELVDWQSDEGKKKLAHIIGHAVGLPEDGLFQ